MSASSKSPTIEEISEPDSGIANDKLWQKTFARMIENSFEVGKDLQEVLTSVIEPILFLTQASAGIIMLLSDNETHLVEAASLGFHVDHPVVLKKNSNLEKNLKKYLSEDIKNRRGSFMFVNLGTKGLEVGVFAIYSSDWSKADLDVKLLLDLVKFHITNGINRTRAFDIAKRRDQITKASLMQLGKAMGDSLDIKRLARQITKVAIAIAEADLCDILLLKGDYLEFQVASGFNKILMGFGNVPLKTDPAASIVSKKKPLLIKNIRHKNRFSDRPWISRKQFKSYIGVPIKQDERVIGVLEAFSRRTSKFNDDDLKLLKSLAGPVAASFNNVGLFEDTKKKAEELRILHTHISRIVAERNIEKMMQEITNAARSAVDSLMAATALYDQETGRFEYRTTNIDPGLGPRALNKNQVEKFSYSEEVYAEILRTGKPLRLDDIRFHKDNGGNMVGSLPLRGFLGVPLVDQDKKPCGLVMVSLKKDGSLFTEADEEVLTTLANQASVAIQNARFYQQLEDRAKGLKSLLEFSKILASEVDLESIFKLIAAATKKMFGVKNGCIFLSDGPSNNLELAYKWGTKTSPMKKRSISVDEDNIVIKAFKSKSQIVIDNVDKYDNSVKSCVNIDPNLKSRIIVPLVVKGKAYGTLSLFAKEPYFFGDEKLPVINIFANQFAVAIQNNRLYAQIAEEKVARREAELSVELLEEKAKNAVVIERNNEGIFMVDSDFRIQVFNPAMELLTDKKATWAIGRKCHEVFKDIFVEGSPCSRCQMFVKNKKPERIKANIRMKNGVLRFVEINHSFIDPSGEKGIIGSVRDITKDHELEIYHHDLRIATEVQSNILPREKPDVPGLDIGFICRPAKQIGGDYFDFIPLDKGKIGIAIGDVSGKSLPAALLVSMHKYILRSAAANTDSVISPLRSLNQIIWEDTSPEVFITTIYGVYDPASATFVYANAGHLPPMLYRDGIAKYLWSPQTPLGIQQSLFIEQQQVKLRKGSILVLLSDGVVDMRNGRGECFGFERLRRLIKKNAHLSSQELADLIYERSVSFSIGEPVDDFTIVVLKCTQDVDKAPSKDLVVANKPIAVTDARKFVTKAMKGTPLSKAEASDVLIAVCEAVTNSVLHGQSPDGEDNNIRISCLYENDYFKVMISDMGIGYNPNLTAWRPPDLVRDRGRGIYLMQQLMEDVEFVSGDRGLTVILSKKANSERGEKNGVQG